MGLFFSGQKKRRNGLSPNSRGEQECQRVLKKIYPSLTFVKVRPSFLRNPQTGRCLELDLYNEDLRLAIEYNGIQHYKYTCKFHSKPEDFEQQKKRDLLKTRLCAEHKICLITIRYDEPDIEAALLRELQKHPRLSPSTKCSLL